MRFARRSSIRRTAGLLIAGVGAAALVALAGSVADSPWLAVGGLAVGIVFAAALALHRERHEVIEAERARLSDQLITAEQ